MTNAFQNAQNMNEEAYSFVEQNASGQTMYTPVQYVSTDSAGNATIGAPPAPATGYTVVGIAHTHPTNYMNTGDPSGIDSAAAGARSYPGDTPYTNTLFSVPDEQYANSYGIAMSVLSEVQMYASDPSAGPAYNWGSWQPGGQIGTSNGYQNGSEGGQLSWTAC